MMMWILSIEKNAMNSWGHPHNSHHRHYHDYHHHCVNLGGEELTSISVGLVIKSDVKGMKCEKW